MTSEVLSVRRDESLEDIRPEFTDQVARRFVVDRTGRQYNRFYLSAQNNEGELVWRQVSRRALALGQLALGDSFTGPTIDQLEANPSTVEHEPVEEPYADDLHGSEFLLASFDSVTAARASYQEVYAGILSEVQIGLANSGQDVLNAEEPTTPESDWTPEERIMMTRRANLLANVRGMAHRKLYLEYFGIDVKELSASAYAETDIDQYDALNRELETYGLFAQIMQLSDEDYSELAELVEGGLTSFTGTVMDDAPDLAPTSPAEPDPGTYDPNDFDSSLARFLSDTDPSALEYIRTSQGMSPEEYFKILWDQIGPGTGILDAPQPTTAPRPRDVIPDPEVATLPARDMEAIRITPEYQEALAKAEKWRGRYATLRVKQSTFGMVRSSTVIKASQAYQRAVSALYALENTGLTPEQTELTARTQSVTELAMLCDRERNYLLSSTYYRTGERFVTGGRLRKVAMMAVLGAPIALGIAMTGGVAGIAAGITVGAIKGSAAGFTRGKLTQAGMAVADINARQARMLGHAQNRSVDNIRRLTVNDARFNRRKSRARVLGSTVMGGVLGAATGGLAAWLAESLPAGGPGSGFRPDQSSGGLTPPPALNPQGVGEVVGNVASTSAAEFSLERTLEYAHSLGLDPAAPNAWPFKMANGLGIDTDYSRFFAGLNGFQFRDGMYWINGRIMNPQEMYLHNLQLVDAAMRLES